MFLLKTKASPVILIEMDGSRFAFHRLRHRLTRIGSDPRSTVFLPESIAERNTAILEWDHGTVRVHNRSGYKFTLGETDIAPNASVEWPDRQILSINDRLNLVLAMDPGKNMSIGAVADESIRLDDVQQTTETTSPKTWILAAILVGLLTVAATKGSGPDHDEQAAALERLIEKASEPAPNHAVRREIVARLQIATRQRFRTGKEDRQVWAELRDFLKSLESESESGLLPDPWFEDLRSLVLHELARSN